MKLAPPTVQVGPLVRQSLMLIPANQDPVSILLLPGGMGADQAIECTVRIISPQHGCRYPKRHVEPRR